MTVENNQNFEFPEQKIVETDLAGEVKNSFINYSVSVIVARALPDVRDGFKPVHRRILYAMNEDHLTYNNPFRKSATTVGNVLGRYHPHGDTAVYDAMVRLAQPFSLRYPLVEGHGNFGNVDGDSAAAYRYTEARMSRMADEMLADIEKDTVDFIPNFDNKLSEPVVLPSRIPNILINGCIGIAVGMATNIPPHNLNEVADGLTYLIDHPDASVTDLMNFIKGPDFPTKAQIFGTSGIYSAYATGHGRVIVRARAEIEEDKHRIIVTEIPYMVNKSLLVESIANCVKEKRIDGITGLRDESGRHGMRIVVEYRRDANGQVILNQLYKYTQMQDTCAVNLLALVDNIPRVLTLKQILEYYLKHREDVISRRTKFELEKALREAHINEGYKIAADHIDEVIDIVRHSASIPDAKEKLCKRFDLTDLQAQAIVDMTIGRLSGLERQKVLDRLEKLYAAIEEYRAILADENKIKEIIKEDLADVKKRFGDERRTEIVPYEDDILLEDLIEKHTCVVTMTRAGYIKRRPADEINSQKRGGKGLNSMTTREEDFVEFVLAVNSHADILFFTDRGKVLVKKAYQIPEAGRTAKGSNVVNLLELEEGEKITSLLQVDAYDERFLTMVTKGGIIKRTPLSEYEYQRKGGKRAITLDEGDSLVFVEITSGEDDIIIATKKGFAVRFHESGARSVGRTARGVTAIRLTENDEVVGAAIPVPDKKLLTVTELGYGKQCEFDDFPLHNRGGKGVICHRPSDKTGCLAGIAVVGENTDVMLITDGGMMIRTPVAGISTYSRGASGVILMRTAENEKIVNVAPVESGSEEAENEE